MAKRRFARRTNRRVLKLKQQLRQKWLRYLLIGAGALFLSGATTVLWWSRDLPNPNDLGTRQVTESTKIYDRTGEHLLYEIGDIHRTVVPLDSISRFVRQATVSAEDDQFYEHRGLDLKGILRAIFVNLRGGSLQGGSTITQQLIKNSILTPERTLQRKVKEAVLALELEQRFSKDEILAMYLNQIPYGSQAYGIEAAAQSFFGIAATDLSLGQSAIIAALPKAPTYYSPYGSHYEDLKRRQENILSRMVKLNMVSQAQADEASQQELNFVQRRESIRAPHFVFYVKELLDAEFGERIVEQGGLTIITTLDAELQNIAEEVLREQEASINSLGGSNAALVAIDPKTGDILAMVGSIDYFNEDIDGNVNVAIRHRSPGSSIKPFIYAAAWQRGYTPQTILVDAETDFGQGYQPKNYDLSQHGPVTMRQALASSLNIPAVKTLYLAGVKSATDLARSMGMESLDDPDRYGLSLVLGGGEVRLVDEVSAYGVFAQDGLRYPHRAILKVDNPEESLLDFTEEAPEGDQVLDPQIARLITDVLSDNTARSLTFGASSSLQLGQRPVAAKTGTTQEFRDGWTMGYTPSLTAGAWVGNNDNTPMGKNSPGARTAAPIWNAFMRRALAGTPIESFVSPAPVKNLRHAVLRGEIPEIKGKWDREAGLIYSNDCPVDRGEPKTFKELHNLLFYVRRLNPLGASPANAEADPQFDRWETGVAAWRDKHNEKTKDNPEEPRYGASLPELTCTIGDSEDLPIVKITDPNTTILRNSPVTVTAQVESSKPVRQVRFILDGEEIGSFGPADSYQASFSFAPSFSGRKTLVIIATTEESLTGRAHRTFIINPDDSPPAVTLHTPQNGQALQATSFPLTVKVTASDPSGVELVDVLYRRTEATSTSRIGQTNTLVPTAANRYEVEWSDSPGPGSYQVYAVVYDTTGNFSESARHQITIE